MNTVDDLLVALGSGPEDGLTVKMIALALAGSMDLRNSTAPAIAGQLVKQALEAGLIEQGEKRGRWVLTETGRGRLPEPEPAPEPEKPKRKPKPGKSRAVLAQLPEAPPDAAPPPRDPARERAARVVRLKDSFERLKGDMDPEERERLVAALAVHGLDDWRIWLPTMFPRLFTAPFGPHHEEFWTWLWEIEAGQSKEPFVGIWNRGGAKFLDLDTPVPTPSGWSTIGQIEPGDIVFDECGKPCRVVGLSPVEERPCYRLTFKGGSEIVASDDHLWTMLDRSSRRVMARHAGGIIEEWASWAHADRPQTVCEVESCVARVDRRGPNGERWCGAHHSRWVRHGDPIAGQRPRARSAPPAAPPTRVFAPTTLTTEELIAAGLRDGNEWRWAVPVAPAFECPHVDLPLDPYLLGYWLGDGTSATGAVTVGHQDATEVEAILSALWPDIRVSDRGHAVNIGFRGLQTLLRSIGVLNNKHVPAVYLRADAKQRAALLAGLLDSDGTVHRDSASFSNTNRGLAAAVHELAVSLGFRASMSEGRSTLNGVDCGPVWRVRVAGAPSSLFRLSRKAGGGAGRPMVTNQRLHYLASAEPVGSRRVRCLTVDSPNHLFLAGPDAIPTHNSASAEAGLVALAARQRRRYALYVSGTQTLADEHVANIGSLLESPELAAAYPALGQRAVGKYGESKGWRRNRLRTAAGFTVDALGLDVAARGARIDEQRPDLIVLDDVDSENDTPATVEKKIRTITRKLLPAGSQDAIVIAIQNVIHSNSIFARLGNLPGAPRVDFLARRRVSGPIPAVWDLEWRQEGDSYRIVGGRPSWGGMSLDACQAMLDLYGLTAFLVECQHEEADLSGGMFDHINFDALRVSKAELPVLRKVGCWVDPAVTSTKRSDSCGIVIDGLGVDRRYYRLWSWERVASPVEALKVAIVAAIEFGAQVVGVETDQGGETWRVVYQAALAELIDDGTIPDGARIPRFDSAKAGSTQLSKVERASRMLADYELGRFRHVEGGAGALEAGLRRFPAHKPFDCVDACLVAGTLVATEDGDKPIESVMPGDRVWTREGLRRVVAAGPTAWDVPVVEVAAGDAVIVGTADHRVWTEEAGWVPMGDLDGLRLAQLTRDTGSWHPKPLPRSSTVAASTADTPTRPVDISRFTTTPPETERAQPSRSTDRSTSTTTARSPKGRSSTTETTTLSTTTRATSWPSPSPSTGSFTGRTGTIVKRCSTTSLRFARSLLRGIGLRTAGRGTASTGSEHGRAESPWSASASSAANGSSPKSPPPDSVRSGAEIEGSRSTRQTRLNERASSVARGSSPSDGNRPATAASPAATVRPAGVAPVVYDLEVEGCHEFFANGLLVHNSYWSWRWLAEAGGEGGKAFRARAPRGSVAEVSV